MFKKKGTHYYSALCLSITVGLLVGAMPALGQDQTIEAFLAEHYKRRVEDGLRVSFIGGTCFKSDPSTESCPVFQLDVRWIPAFYNAEGVRKSNQFPRSRWARALLDTEGTGAYAGVGGAIMAARGDTWPEPEPPGPPENNPTFSAKTGDVFETNQEQQKANHNGTYSVVGKVDVIVPVQSWFLVEPFIGAGVAWISEGDAEAPNTVAIAGQTMPVIRYGIGLTAPLGKMLDVRFQYSGSIYFPDELEYIDAEGISFSRDIHTLSTSSLMVGIGLRVPYKRKK